MLRKDLSGVKVNKGNEEIKGKDPQDKKGTAKLADTGTQSNDKTDRQITELDRGNKRQRSLNTQKKLSTAKGEMKYLREAWISMDSE